MNDILDLIRAATSDGATTDQKRAAAAACRTLAAALDAAPGQSIAPPPPPNPFAVLAGLDVDQVLELIIANLRRKLGGDATTPAPSGFRAPLLKLPSAGVL